eukprot:GSChrysophyteH1.ASY1.ANO1.945.1 assembled CDS
MNQAHLRPTSLLSAVPEDYRASFVNYVAGVFGGVSVVLVGHPFDTTKTRMQTAPRGFYMNTLDAVTKTWKNEGIRGFYRGITSPLYGQMFFRAASFMTFYSCLDTISSMRGDAASGTPSAASTIIAGAVTGSIISALETPIDVVKTKLQIQIFRQTLHPQSELRYKTFRGCVSYITKKHGSRALWQGWQATMIRNIPANALFFPVNELLKARMAAEDGVRVEDLSMGKKLAAGGAAGMSYWTLTYPLDAIKGRLMAQSWRHRMRYMDIVRVMKPMDFFTGIIPCAARGAVACAVMFYTVDTIRVVIWTL